MSLKRFSKLGRYRQCFGLYERVFINATNNGKRLKQSKLLLNRNSVSEVEFYPGPLLRIIYERLYGGRGYYNPKRHLTVRLKAFSSTARQFDSQHE